jgi:hypothetical protein
MNKNFLYEFFGLPLSRKSITMENGQEIELGKIYTGTGFGSINTNEEYCAECDDDIDEYDVDEDDIEEMEDFISFLKTKVKEKEMYNESTLEEAEYQGREVKLGKPTAGDVKKFKVYVKNPAGKVVKVNFGHGGTSAAAKGEKTMRIRKSNPKARKSFRARHNCDNPGPRTKARYWSCRKW